MRKRQSSWRRKTKELAVCAEVHKATQRTKVWRLFGGAGEVVVLGRKKTESSCGFLFEAQARQLYCAGKNRKRPWLPIRNTKMGVKVRTNLGNV
jgi:hypothetical protein